MTYQKDRIKQYITCRLRVKSEDDFNLTLSNITEKIARSKLLRYDRNGFLSQEILTTNTHKLPEALDNIHLKIFSQDRNLTLNTSTQNTTLTILLANTIQDEKIANNYGLKILPILKISKEIDYFFKNLHNVYPQYKPVIKEYLKLNYKFTKKGDDMPSELDFIISNLTKTNTEIYGNITIMKSREITLPKINKKTNHTYADLLIGNFDAAELVKEKLSKEYKSLSEQIQQYTDIFSDETTTKKFLLIDSK